MAKEETPAEATQPEESVSTPVEPTAEPAQAQETATPTTVTPKKKGGAFKIILIMILILVVVGGGDCWLGRL